MTRARAVVWGSSALALLVWVLQSTHWWAHLEGDNPLYPLMSVQVLRGHHYLMTAGQAHGGTPLVYLRAALFWLFGVRHFLGFLVNGVAVAAGVWFWARFACVVGGPLAGAVMGVLGAIGTESFARAASTDYYGLTVLTSGVMHWFASRLALKDAVAPRDAFGAGLLLGFSWYVCRFSALYFLPAAAFFLVLGPQSRRILMFPTRVELRSAVSRILLFAVVTGFALSVAAFFTSDRFLGINAESNMKVVALLGAALWLWHRGRVLALFPRLVGAFAGGALVGLVPDLAFKWSSNHADRVTGLVRWDQLGPVMHELPRKLGYNLSYYSPMKWGLVAALCGAAALLVGLDTQRPRAYLTALFGLGIALAAWTTVHTYMFFVPQYFFPVFFPLYLALALAVGCGRRRAAALSLVIPIALVGLADLAGNVRSENYFLASGVLEKLSDWRSRYGVDTGFGHYPSNYNLMWAARGEWKLPYRDPDERFPEWQDAARTSKRIVYVLREGDRTARWPHEDYRVLESAKLGDGFTAELLEKL